MDTDKNFVEASGDVKFISNHKFLCEQGLKLISGKAYRQEDHSNQNPIGIHCEYYFPKIEGEIGTLIYIQDDYVMAFPYYDTQGHRRELRVELKANGMVAVLSDHSGSLIRMVYYHRDGGIAELSFNGGNTMHITDPSGILGTQLTAVNVSPDCDLDETPGEAIGYF